MKEQRAPREAATGMLFGVVVGFVLGVATGVFPASAWIIAPAVVLAFFATAVSRPIRYDRLASLGGVLVGAGAFFIYGIISTVAACIGTTDFCGRADVTPVTLVAASLLAMGCLVGLVASRRGRA
jgi:uncharacterized membrane protein